MTQLLSPKQIWLLTYENPLPKRFGKDFFRSIPTCPGIYYMLDENDHILYIGKAKNLKNRLQSYKRIKPDQSSRKLLRLVHLIRQIRWEECESEVAALLRENYLLRTHQPYFNSINTHPESYYFIEFGTTLRHFDFSLTTSPKNELQWQYGAFKGRGLIRSGYAALLRMIWAAIGNSDEDRFEFPGVLTRRTVPYSYTLLIKHALDVNECKYWKSLIQRFLKGTSSQLLHELTEKMLDKTTIPAFMYHMIQSDLETLDEFFKYGPKRNRSLKRFHNIREAVLQQEQIDDLLVTYRLRGVGR